MTRSRFPAVAVSGLTLISTACAPTADSLYQELIGRVPAAALEGVSTSSASLSCVGEVTLLSTQPADFPESTFSAGAYIAVSGPASFVIPPGQPGTISLHHRWTGAWARSIEIPYPPFLPPDTYPNALSVAAPGALGDIFVNQVLTGIYRVNSLLGLGEQYTTGPVPDIPPCFVDSREDCSASWPCADPPIPGAPPCSQALGLPPLGNSLLINEDGYIYVSDSFQGAIWLVRPETRSYELWLTAVELQGDPQSSFPAGANGLAKGPDGFLYICNTSAGPFSGGAIYRVPILPNPSPDDIELVIAWEPFLPPGIPFPMPVGPDGLRFDVEGNLWLTMTMANIVAKLTLEGGQVVHEERFEHQPTGSIGFNQPSELHLDSRQRRAFVANHALEPPTPEDWALFALATGVRGAPLEKPWLGWDCEAHDCSIDPNTLDFPHLVQLVYEELWGL